jgi:hypothetical protein
LNQHHPQQQHLSPVLIKSATAADERRDPPVSFLHEPASSASFDVQDHQQDEVPCLMMLD